MQSITLSAPWRKLLLTVHVVATVSVLGTDLVLLALGLSSLGGADPRTIYPAAHLVGARLVAPLAVLALGTGLLLGVLTPWGLFRYWWVTIKLAITAVLTGVVLFVLVPRLGAAADAVTGPAPRLLTSAERLPFVIAPSWRSSSRAGACDSEGEARLPVFAPSLTKHLGATTRNSTLSFSGYWRTGHRRRMARFRHRFLLAMPQRSSAQR